MTHPVLTLNLTGYTRKIFVSNIFKTVDESHSARVLIGCKPITLNWTCLSSLLLALFRALALAYVGLEPARLTSIQLAIFEIQANLGCLDGAGCSVRQNSGGDYLVGPKMTCPDLVLSLNWT